MKNSFLETTLKNKFKTISTKKGLMEHGAMISRYKQSLKFTQDQFKSMYLEINPFEHFMSKMKKMSSPLG